MEFLAVWDHILIMFLSTGPYKIGIEDAINKWFLNWFEVAVIYRSVERFN